MKRLLSLALLIVSTCCPKETSSQTKFHFEIGAGYVSSSLSESLLNNWNRGWTSGLGISYNAASTLQLSVNAAYQNHSYRGDHLQLATPRVIGFRRESDAPNGHVYELSLGARFISSRKSRLFFALRGGLLWMDIGKISIRSWRQQRPEQKTYLVYQGSGKSYQKGFAALGFGFLLRIRSNINLILESRCIDTFDQETDVILVPIASSLQIRL